MRSLQARIRRYNSDIEPGSDTFRAAVLLLAGLEFGQNVEVLMRRTGFPRAFVAKCARRLIDNGVWVGGATVAEWSAEDEASGAFWNDVAVAEGKLCRRVNAQGEIEWAPAGYWQKSYEFIEPADQPLSAVYRDPVPPVAEPAAPEPGPPGTAVPPAGEALPGPAAPAEDAQQDGEPASAHDPAAPSPAPPEPKRTPPPDELFPGTVWLG